MEDNFDKIIYAVILIIIYAVTGMLKKKKAQQKVVVPSNSESPHDIIFPAKKTNDEEIKEVVKKERKRILFEDNMFLSSENEFHHDTHIEIKDTEIKDLHQQKETKRFNIKDAVIYSEIFNRKY